MSILIPPARFRRIIQKMRLRFGFAAWMLWRYEDTIPRSVCRVSFSQSGEDLIAQLLFHQLGIERPRYLDIGAHHPYHLSNTALFYALGARGLNIEPDAELHAAFVRERPGDINLCAGIGTTAGALTFYRMEDRSLSTFSATEARRVAQECHIPIVAEVPVPVRTINEVLAAHDFRPDFLTIDVEGKDLEILQSYDFQRYRPAVICAESISFSTDGTGQKNTDLLDFLVSQGYRIHADTRINTLLVDAALRLR